MNYDLILRNASVIDPSQGINAVRDVGVAGDRIGAVAPSLEAPAGCAVRDLSGLYLCPGLVDIHGHWYEGSLFGIDAGICLNHGVTTAVDAGTTGYLNFAEFRRTRMEGSPLRLLAFLNISALGIPGPLWGELEDPRYVAAVETAELLEEHADVLLGVKVRLGSRMCASNCAEALKRALSAAASSRKPVMVHISNGGGTPAALGRLRPGDIVTHCFQGRGDGLVNGASLIPEALDARRNGVLFDVGHGCGSFCWQTARKAFEHHFYPDIISTDLHRYSVERFSIDMPTTMSKFLHLGIPLEDIVLKTTWAPSRAIGRESEIGTLRSGAVADIFVFSIEEGEFELEDTHLRKVKAGRRVVPRLVIQAGKIIQPGSYPVMLRRLRESDLTVFRQLEETA